MKKKLAVFDMDGTVLYTLDDLASAINYALAMFGYPEKTVEEVRLLVGNGLKRLAEDSVPEGTAPEMTEQVFRAFVDRYAEHFADETRPYDGITETLARLKESGMLLALVTNKDTRMAYPLCETFFPGIFDCVVGASKDLRPKPAPDGVLRAAEALSVSPCEAFYIGDSEVDLRTSENAGTETVIVAWGYRTLPELAALGIPDPVRTPADLLKLLL